MQARPAPAWTYFPTVALVVDDKDDEPEKKKDKTKKQDRKKEEKKEFNDLGDITAEIAALQVLHALDLKTSQLKALAAVAATTAQKPPARKKVLATESYRKALLTVRQALIGRDNEKIAKAFTAFEELRNKDSAELPELRITEAAREEAPAIFRRLNARQLVLFLAGQAQDFPDPTERLLQGIKQSRKLRGKDWLGQRDLAAFQVGWLVGGLDETREAQVRDRAAALLQKAAGLSDEDYDEQAASLRKEARELVGKVSPTTVIRHYVERALIETLSNHRLAAAVQARLKKK
jgi:hypothetical protein